MSFHDTTIAAPTGATLFRPAAPVETGSAYARLARATAGGLTLLATCEAFELHGFPVFASPDGGRTWGTEPVSVVTEPLEAGTGWRLDWQPTLLLDGDRVLLAGTSIRRDESGSVVGTKIRLFASHDEGRSWDFRATVAEGRAGDGNVWEPELQRIGDGLVAFYSTEAHQRAGLHQAIAHRVSHDDGATWGDEVLDVFADDGHSRPGMPIVRRFDDGSFRMVYEVCDAAGGPCRIYLTRSADGLSWPPEPRAEAVATSDDRYLHSTPAMAVHGDHLYVTAMGAKGYPHRVVLERTGPDATWRERPAPVQWQGGNDHAGYSQALLAVGGTLVHLAPSAIDGGANEIRYATEHLSDAMGDRA